MISPLRARRFFAELSLYDLMQKTGIDSAKISLIERGYKIPRKDEKEKFTKALGCKVAEIFPEDGGSKDD